MRFDRDRTLFTSREEAHAHYAEQEKYFIQAPLWHMERDYEIVEMLEYSSRSHQIWQWLVPYLSARFGTRRGSKYLSDEALAKISQNCVEQAERGYIIGLKDPAVRFLHKYGEGALVAISLFTLAYTEALSGWGYDAFQQKYPPIAGISPIVIIEFVSDLALAVATEYLHEHPYRPPEARVTASDYNSQAACAQWLKAQGASGEKASFLEKAQECRSDPERLAAVFSAFGSDPGDLTLGYVWERAETIVEAGEVFADYRWLGLDVDTAGYPAFTQAVANLCALELRRERVAEDQRAAAFGLPATETNYVRVRATLEPDEDYKYVSYRLERSGGEYVVAIDETHGLKAILGTNASDMTICELAGDVYVEQTGSGEKFYRIPRQVRDGRGELFTFVRPLRLIEIIRAQQACPVEEVLQPSRGQERFTLKPW